MNDDPFEKLRIDLDSALSELTDSTRARLDGIAVAPPPRVDAVSVLRGRGPVHDRPMPPPSVEAVETGLPTDEEPAPPRPGSPPVRVRRSVRPGAVRVVAPGFPAEPAPVLPVEVERARERKPAVRAPVPAGRVGSDHPTRPTRPTPPRARPALAPSPTALPLRMPPPAPASGRHRALVAIGLVAVLVLVVVGGFLASRPGPVGDEPSAVAPADTLPLAPASAPDPGRLVRVEPQPDGSVEVTQWLSFDSPVRSVEVVAPTSRRDGRRLSTATVEGQGLATVRLTGVEAPQVVTFRSATDRVRMRYTVRDAVDISERDDRRALVDVPAVRIGPGGSEAGPTVLRVAGANVRGVACGRTLRTVRPCGDERGRGWSLRTPSVDSTAVLATVDMRR